MAELSPFAAQYLHWRAARAEAATPGVDDAEREERIRRLAFAAILQDSPAGRPLLEELGEANEAEALRLSGDAGWYVNSALTGALRFTNPPISCHVAAVGDRLCRWMDWRLPVDLPEQPSPQVVTAGARRSLEAWKAASGTEAHRLAMAVVVTAPAVLTALPRDAAARLCKLARQSPCMMATCPGAART